MFQVTEISRVQNGSQYKAPKEVQPRIIAVDGNGVSVQDLISVANGHARVSLTADAKERILLSRQVLEECAAKGQTIYGMTTRLGPYLSESISASDISEIQLRTIMEHAVRHGTELTSREVRAMMFARLNGFAKGTSGVRMETANALAQLINRDVHPTVVGGSSVGASDLSEMAQIALVLVGLGEAEFHGMRMSGAQALKLAGLEPIELAGKEGLSLISNNGYSVGVGALVLNDACVSLQCVNVAAATSLEAIQGNLTMLHAAASDAKAHPGHIAVSRVLRKMLDGSSLWQVETAFHLQDPLSFRCIANVHGALQEILSKLKDTIEIELNSGSDNPFVDIDSRAVYSVGNFDTTSICMGFDGLRVALTASINMLNERVQKLMNTEFTGLPTGLKSGQNDGVGLIPLARAVAAITAESQSLAAPVSIQFRSQLGCGHEDFASLAPLSVTNTAKLVENLVKLSSLEILIACAALAQRPAPKLGRTTQLIANYVAKAPVDYKSWDMQMKRVMEELRSEKFARRLESPIFACA